MLGRQPQNGGWMIRSSKTSSSKNEMREMPSSLGVRGRGGEALMDQHMRAGICWRVAALLQEAGVASETPRGIRWKTS